MTAYLPYVARVAAPGERFTQAHLRDDFDVESYEDVYVRGSVTSATMVVKNPGVALLGPNSPQYVIVSESPDGTAANARVLLRGRIVPTFRVGASLAAGRIELSIEAAPVDIKNRKLAYAMEHLTALPQFEPLCGDLDWDRLDNVLVATSKSWFVHPATHEIGVLDNLEGDRVYDLGSDYDRRTFKFDPTGTAPARRVKIRATVQLTQRAYGVVDIAAQVNGPATYISTMDADHFEGQRASLPTQYVNYATGGGWRKEEGSDVVVGASGTTGWITTGQRYLLQERDQYVDNGDGTGAGTFYPVDPYYVDERATLPFVTYRYLYNHMLYDYTQPRAEKVEVYLDYPVQDVAGVQAVVDLGEVSVGDVYVGLRPNPLPPPDPDQYGDYVYPYSAYVPVLPHDYAKIYNAGDLVTYGFATYECQNDEVQGTFYDINLGPVISHRNWVQVPSLAALPDPRSPSFVDTARGQRFVEHLLLRADAKARNLSLAARAEFTTDWESGIKIKARDTVRLTYWDPSTRSERVLKGTVKERRREISWKRRKMSFVLSIPCGDGTDEQVPQIGPTAYYDPSLDAESYYKNVTSHLGLSGQQLRDQYLSIYNFTRQYPEELLGSFGFGQIAWTYGAQPLVAPVDAFQLSNPFYAVFRVQHVNEASYQFGQCVAYGFRGWDPRDAVYENPTSVNVTMRNIGAAATIERRYDVAAQSMRAPRGIDLVDGGEP